MKIGVLGGGSWGSAIAKLLGELGNEVMLWCFEADVVTTINRSGENKMYLPGFNLGPGVRATNDPIEVVKWSKLIVSVVPSHVLRSVLRRITVELTEDHYFVSCTKGIELDSLKLMSEVISEHFPFPKRILALSGPSFAVEVADRKPTAVVISCLSEEIGRKVQSIFAAPYFRTYYNSDIIGVEISGAMKNVMAIASGIVIGANWGQNAMAGLITRGLYEITLLGMKLGAAPTTFSGLSGMGDLILTCTGSLSRNRTVGVKIGEGQSLTDILKGMTMVAEGVTTTRSAYRLAERKGIAMPITNQVHQILFEGKSPVAGLKDLMERELRDEIDYR